MHVVRIFSVVANGPDNFFGLINGTFAPNFLATDAILIESVETTTWPTCFDFNVAFIG